MNPQKDAEQPTDEWVPLADLIKLARLGSHMRRCQRRFFDAKKKAPHIRHDKELSEARDAEQRFDSAVHDALAREQLPLPGFTEGGDRKSL